MAVLGLRGFARAFSSWRAGAILCCGAWASHHSDVSCCGGRALGPWASVVTAQVSLVVVAYRLSCSIARGIFLDQTSSPCPQHWQVDSCPLHHQGSP